MTIIATAPPTAIPAMAPGDRLLPLGADAILGTLVPISLEEGAVLVVSEPLISLDDGGIDCDRVRISEKPVDANSGVKVGVVFRIALCFVVACESPPPSPSSNTLPLLGKVSIFPLVRCAQRSSSVARGSRSFICKSVFLPGLCLV